MMFTYECYSQLLDRLLIKGYNVCDYKNWNKKNKTVILRHDIDYNLENAIGISEIENKICGGGATYFVLLSTNFYNIFSKESRNILEKIKKNGGLIGLHFDETQYRITSQNDMITYINQEIEILSSVVDEKIDVVSMHRPSKEFLSMDLQLPKVINSYSKVFFEQMKYLSDSRRNWRENVEEIIEKNKYERLHILTHPFWYSDSNERTLDQTLKDAILNAALEYYDNMNDNFRDLKLEIERKDIERIIKR